MPTDIAGDRNRFAQQLFTSLPKRYDRLAEILSMGQNGRWRRAMVDHVVPTSPSRDAGRGFGHRGRSPPTRGTHVVQYRRGRSDQEHARSWSGECGRSGKGERVKLVAGRAEQLPFPEGTFDALTFTYLLRYVDDPPGDTRRVGQGRQARRHRGQPRVLLAAESLLAFLVVALHPTGPPRAGGSPGDESGSVWADFWAPTSPRSLPEVSLVVDGGRVASGRFRAGRGTSA